MGEVRKRGAWREQPASDGQKRELDRLSIPFEPDISAGTASDLMTASEPVGDDQRKILRFFKVSASGMNALDARRAIEALFADPQKKSKWKGRPADREQREALAFFGREVTRGLTHAEAQAMLDAILEDDASADALLAHQDAIEDEREWWESTQEELNDYASDYGCRKLSKALFKQTVEALQADEVQRSAIGYEIGGRFFTKAAELDPSIVRDPQELRSSAEFEAGYMPERESHGSQDAASPAGATRALPWVVLAIAAAAAGAFALLS
jgi:hypothetical protein